VPASGTMKPIGDGRQLACPVRGWKVPTGRGLLSSTFQLNVSAFCGIGGAFRRCSGAV
jgi:hypothetical protein